MAGKSIKKKSVIRAGERAKIRRGKPVTWEGREGTEQRWDRMVEDANEEVRKGLEPPKPPRYRQQEACWKRTVYSFVCRNMESASEAYSLERYVEQLILGVDGKRLPRSPEFAINPFHWVLAALSADGQWPLGRDKIFRFGRLLNYARAHHVPEEFLIGFLYQAGTPAEVEKKAGNGSTEPWRDRWIEQISH